MTGRTTSRADGCACARTGHRAAARAAPAAQVFLVVGLVLAVGPGRRAVHQRGGPRQSSSGGAVPGRPGARRSRLRTSGPAGRAGWRSRRTAAATARRRCSSSSRPGARAASGDTPARRGGPAAGGQGGALSRSRSSASTAADSPADAVPFIPEAGVTFPVAVRPRRRASPAASSTSTAIPTPSSSTRRRARSAKVVAGRRC